MLSKPMAGVQSNGEHVGSDLLQSAANTLKATLVLAAAIRDLDARLLAVLVHSVMSRQDQRCPTSTTACEYTLEEVANTCTSCV